MMKRYKKEIYIAIIIVAVVCLFGSYIPGLQFLAKWCKPPVMLFLGLAYAFFCGQGYPTFNKKTSKALLQFNSPSYDFTQINLHYAMEKFNVPIVSILGLFLVVFVVLASTDRTTTAALFGAGYSAFLMAIYALIPAFRNFSDSRY